MKKTLLNRGFTLIELLVVIAIIGILAAVVLASLNDARDGGTDASIKQSLSNLRSQAEIVYNQGGFTYSGVCADPKVDQLFDAATANGQATAIAESVAITANNHSTCRDDVSGWMVAVPLIGTADAGDRWCVDSTGFSGQVDVADVADISTANDLECKP